MVENILGFLVARKLADACEACYENPQKIGRTIRDVKDKISDICNDTPAREIYWRETKNYVVDKFDDLKTGFNEYNKVTIFF
ncbi:MAG: hypothetical protein QMC67_13580 [Candidatus Wallbacteria bacterium]